MSDCRPRDSAALDALNTGWMGPGSVLSHADIFFERTLGRKRCVGVRRGLRLDIVMVNIAGRLSIIYRHAS